MDPGTFKVCLRELRRHPHWLDPSATGDNSPAWLKAWRAYPLKLAAKELATLRRIGLSFGRPDNLWIDKYLLLWRFHQKHGHCRFVARSKQGFRSWLTTQRGLRRKGRLAPKREQALNKLDFVWNLKEAFWQERIRNLKQFIARHGHANPPGSHRSQFGVWVANIRRRRSHLTPQQRRQLDRLGFVWNPEQDSRAHAMDELRRFFRRFGHGNVPARSAEYPAAGPMIQTARKRYHQNRLASATIRELESLKVDWRPEETLWHQRLQELGAVYKRHGHSHLPKGWPENPTLERWARNQRERFRYLPPQKRKMLLKIGFDPAPGKPGSKGHSSHGKS